MDYNSRNIFIILGLVIIILLFIILFLTINPKDNLFNENNTFLGPQNNSNSNIITFPCSLIHGEENQVCIEKKKISYIDDESFCYSFKEESKNICLFFYARKKNNLELCDEFKEPISVTSCKKQVRIFNGDESVCYETDTDEEKWNCFASISYLPNGVMLCNKIESIEIKNNCYYNYAVSNVDDSYCSIITSEDTLNRCYRDVAWVSLDNKLCEKVPREYDKETCYKLIERDSKNISTD